MRFCRRDGSIDLKQKGAPGEQPEEFLPWFDMPDRASRAVRVICGHWSTLGYQRRKDLLALDTGCVWGGALTAVNLDEESEPVQLGCKGNQQPGEG
jgi:bis(5'-nucleosyl)-tetraphosphatase (symmetrical)